MRPSWDEYFLEITKLTATRSNCLRKQVGCIIVKNNRIIGTGYNGTPQNTINCVDGGCERCANTDKYKSGEKLDLCLCLHAEENALLFSSKDDIKDSTLYCTHFPCIGCTKKIVQCQVSKVIYINDYCSEVETFSMNMFKSSNVEVAKISL